MFITGTHINYFFVCKRKLWLFSNGIQMEHTSDLVSEGKFIHESTYLQRSSKYTELEIEGIKIDFYDAKNQVVHEVKKSSAKEEAHVWQVKYYLYVLRKNGVENPTGILEYPKLRQTEEVLLTSIDSEQIQSIKSEIFQIIYHDNCPEVLPISKCKHCSYFDFCWINEDS